MRTLSIDPRLEAIAGKPAGVAINPIFPSILSLSTPLVAAFTLFAIVTPNPDFGSQGVQAVCDGMDNSHRAALQLTNTGAWTLTSGSAGLYAPNGAESYSGKVAVVGIVKPGENSEIWRAGTRIAAQAVLSAPPAPIASLRIGTDRGDTTSTTGWRGQVHAFAAYALAPTDYQRRSIMHKLLQMSGGGGRTRRLPRARRSDFGLAA